jgi:cysteine desulfurase/selenocysteine lyase
MLPWRISGRDTRFIHIDRFGILDLDDLERQLKQAPTNRPRLVALSGAYNTTGYTPPIHEIARITHRYGGQVLIDAAQLVAHRPISMRGSGPDDAIDFLVFSSHKLYAPYGAGAVVGPREAFRATPDLVGGGIVDLVTLNRVVWAEIPDREEAGSPNVIGVVALHAAVERLHAIGMHNIERHEAALSAYAFERFSQVPGLRLLGRPGVQDRVGLFAFGLGELSGYLVAAILGHEWGVGVRAGCFCAHPGMMHLMDISPESLPSLEEAIILGRNLGAVRASLGLYNSAADIDVLIDGLCAVAAGQIRGHYEMAPSSGEYEPSGWQPRFADYFRIGG